MLIPSTRLFTAGELETGAYLNSAITNATNFMLGKPITVLTTNAVQSIPNAAYTPILFQVENIDRDNAHSTVTNTDRFTAQTPGWYFFTGTIAYASNSAGYRRAYWQCSNGTPAGAFASTAGYLINQGMPATSILHYLSVGDYMTLSAYQDTGGALNTIASGGVFSSMNVIWVSS
jgi:hypothetical protein